MIGWFNISDGATVEASAAISDFNQKQNFCSSFVFLSFVTYLFIFLTIYEYFCLSNFFAIVVYLKATFKTIKNIACILKYENGVSDLNFEMYAKISKFY